MSNLNGLAPESIHCAGAIIPTLGRPRSDSGGPGGLPGNFARDRILELAWISGEAATALPREQVVTR